MQEAQLHKAARIVMRDAARSLHTILAAAEAGQPLAASEEDLRARLANMLEHMPLRDAHSRGEHRMLCRALDKMAKARAA